MENEFLSQAEQLKEDAIKMALSLRLYEAADEIARKELTEANFVPKINSYVICHGDLRIYYPNLENFERQIDIKLKDVMVFQAGRDSRYKIHVFAFKNGDWVGQLLEIRDRKLEKEILDKFGPVPTQPLVKSLLYSCWDKLKLVCSKIFGTINKILEEISAFYSLLFRDFND